LKRLTIIYNQPQVGTTKISQNNNYNNNDEKEEEGDEEKRIK